MLDVYVRPVAPCRPWVCLDETKQQQVREVVAPLPMQPGVPHWYASTYARPGGSNVPENSSAGVSGSRPRRLTRPGTRWSGSW
jgi:hypothetical protein